jgi:hypothetical protein
MLQTAPVPAVTHWWSFFPPTDAASLWTMVVALATVGLSFAAVRGLRSLRLTRTEMTNRATRESYQCAIDRCDEMARELLPALTKLFDELTARKVFFFVTETHQVSFDEKEELKKINSAIAWMRQLNSDELRRMIELMNRLEVWSMYFTTDPALAAQKVAYEPCSTPFCQLVMALYPALLTQRRLNPASGPFQNVVTLFKGWYAKKAQGPMLEQLARLQSDGAKLPEPVGTSLDDKA